MSLLSRMLAANNSSTSGPITYVGGYTAGYVGTTSTITVPLTSLTGGIASSPSAGDLVVMYFAISPSTTITLPSPLAFKEVTQLYSNDTLKTKLYVGYKFLGVETSIALVNGTWDTTFAGAVAVQVWRNVDAITPFDVSFTPATGLNGALCDPPSITPTTPGSVIIAGGAAAHDKGTATFSSSDLSNFLSSGGSDTYDITVGMGSYNWTSGLFNPAAFTFSATNSSSYSWAAVTLALRKKQYSINIPYYIDFSATNLTTSGTNVTVSKPAGTATGDLMIAYVCTQGSKTGTWTNTTGWTEVVDKGSGPYTMVAYKVATSSEPASYTFTSSGSGTNQQAAIVVFRNAAFDAAGSLVSTPDLSNTASVSVSQDYSIVVGVGVAANQAVTISPPSNMTRRYIENDASGVSSAVAEGYVSAGTISKTFTVDASPNTFDLVLLSLKPA